jgi:hypothetical protein
MGRRRGNRRRPSGHVSGYHAESLAVLRVAGVSLVERPEERSGKVEVGLLASNDGAVRCERAAQFLEAGRPVFIDEPRGATPADARALVAPAARHGAPLPSASSLCFTEAPAMRERGEQVGPPVE